MTFAKLPLYAALTRPGRNNRYIQMKADDLVLSALNKCNAIEAMGAWSRFNKSYPASAAQGFSAAFEARAMVSGHSGIKDDVYRLIVFAAI